MATQRITLAKVAGTAGAAVAERFRVWINSRIGEQTRPSIGSSSKRARTSKEHRISGPDQFPPAVRREIDGFAELLRANAAVPPVVYFTEWVDFWSMGDVVPGLGVAGTEVVYGDKFQACCQKFPVGLTAPTVGGKPTQESKWLAARLKESESAWKPIVTESVLVVLREPLGGTVTDEELSASLQSVPSWLSLEI